MQLLDTYCREDAVSLQFLLKLRPARYAATRQRRQLHRGHARQIMLTANNNYRSILNGSTIMLDAIGQEGARQQVSNLQNDGSRLCHRMIDADTM